MPEFRKKLELSNLDFCTCCLVQRLASTILGYSEQTESEDKDIAKILYSMLKQWTH